MNFFFDKYTCSKDSFEPLEKSKMDIQVAEIKVGMTPVPVREIFMSRWCAKYVHNAVAQSEKFLTLLEFIRVTGFELDMKSFDVLFNNINDEGIPVYLSDSLLDWMGYEGGAAKQIQSCKLVLKSNFTVIKITKKSTFIFYVINLRSNIVI